MCHTFSRYTCVISLWPTTKVRPSLLRFSRKLQVILSVKCRSLTPILYPTWTINVESTQINYFTPYSKVWLSLPRSPWILYEPTKSSRTCRVPNAIHMTWKCRKFGKNFIYTGRQSVSFTVQKFVNLKTAQKITCRSCIANCTEIGQAIPRLLHCLVGGVTVSRVLRKSSLFDKFFIRISIPNFMKIVKWFRQTERQNYECSALYKNPQI